MKYCPKCKKFVEENLGYSFCPYCIPTVKLIEVKDELNKKMSSLQ